jgi:hypothetical protein
MAILDLKLQNLVFIVLLFTIAGPVNSQTDKRLDSRLQAAILSVRSAKSPDARYDAAEQLPTLTSKSRPGSVADSTVESLIGLLDDPDDGVRMFVAATLGNIQAKAAIPKMLALLPAADCLDGTLTSSRSIRFALARMGVSPPPAPSSNDCHKSK